MYNIIEWRQQSKYQDRLHSKSSAKEQPKDRRVDGRHSKEDTDKVHESSTWN